MDERVAEFKKKKKEANAFQVPPVKPARSLLGQEKGQSWIRKVFVTHSNIGVLLPDVHHCDRYRHSGRTKSCRSTWFRVGSRRCVLFLLILEIVMGPS